MLVASDFDRLVETRLRLRLAFRPPLGSRALPYQLAVEAVPFRFAIVLPGLVHRVFRRCQRLQPRLPLSLASVGVGQQALEVRIAQDRARGVIGFQPFAHQRDACLLLSLFRQRPTTQEGRPRAPERETLLGRQRDGCIGIFLRESGLAAELVQFRGLAQGMRQAEGVGKLPRQRKPVLRALEGLVRIAKSPEHER
ncbi:hypothetical protein D9M68_453700 [compost metagenome]